MWVKTWSVVLGAALLCGAARVQAQAPGDTVRLTLSEAVGRALERSEEVRVARSQQEQAAAQARSARSALLPQISTSLVYTKTLRSVFQDAGFTLPDSLKFEPDSLGSVLDRLRYLEEKTPNAAFGALGSMFGNLPFGRENTWIMAASVTQPVFAGGRILYSVALAENAADAARAGLAEAAAEVALQVRLAYLGARLAEAAEAIVAGSVELARAHRTRVGLQHETGRASELDVLRAEVELQNLLPQHIEAQQGRELALQNLRRLVNVPPDSALLLATSLDPADPELPDVAAVRLPTLEEAERRFARRAALEAAGELVELRRDQLKVARAAYLPTIGVSGNFARQAYPIGTWPEGDWRDDWSVSVALQWNLFQGLRRGADMDAAQAQVREAELQRVQLHEGVRLEYQQARGDVERARAQIQTAGTTVLQAQRVHDLTELRFSEGLATQLDVSSARLALQSARLNAARAHHDFYAAMARAERALGVPAGVSWTIRP